MDWQTRVRSAFITSRDVPDDDVIEELAQHAQAVYDGARARGESHGDANRLSERLIDKWVSDASSLRRHAAHLPAITPPPGSSEFWLRGLAQDLRYALRLLTRQPRFAALVILTMALGIAATSTLFSVTYGVLMKPLPWPTADRLVLLKETRGGFAPRFGSFSNTAYVAWHDEAQALEEIGGWTRRSVILSGDGDPVRVRAAAVTASVFRALGAHAVAGSLFDDQDEERPVVVISEGLWQQRYDRDPRAIGRSVQLDGEARTVVGVLPDAMAFPDRQVNAWVPFRVPLPAGNKMAMFEAIGRLRPGATVEQAAAEGTARGRFAADTGMTTMAIFGGDGAVQITARPFAEALTADVRQPLIVLLAAVLCLLGIAAANVASLQLVRTASRRRELAIRASIGASGRRLVRQLLLESLALGIAGGLAGLGLAWMLQRSAIALLPSDFPRVTDIALDGPVMAFAAAASIVSGMAFGLLPAWRLRRMNLVETLSEDGVSPVGMSRRTGAAATRLVIVTGQIAVACVLLVAAMLLARSFVRQLNADRGYDPARVLGAQVTLPAPRYTPARRSEVLAQLVDRLKRVPGVRAAAFTTELPLTPGGSTSAFTLAPRDAGGAPISVQASPRIVSADYFSALGLRILAGRSLAASDIETSEPVCVVNQTFQRKYLGAEAVGVKVPMALFGQSQEGEATIVGVAEDVRYIGSAATSLAELYFSHRQLKVGVRPTIATLLLRADADPHALASPLRSVVTAIDASLVPEGVMTLEDRLLAGSLARPRLYAVLIAGFAALSLAITAVGLFGVLSYTVSQRTRELGVRAALGARRWDLVRLILRQGLVVAGIGTAIGLGASIWLTRFISTLLYGVGTTDLVTYLLVPAVVFVVSLTACLVPARRAAMLDPLKALRS
jgi:predicted permease